MELSGLHHVTAVTAKAAENVAFYTNVLGLRLVKKTVNQDDVSAYHLFYGDGMGNAGTEVTFFDWATMGPNRPGSGEIAAIGLRVSDRETLDWWVRRFDEADVTHGEIEHRAGHPMLPFTDPEGQRFDLVAGASDTGFAFTPWENSAVPAERQIRGLSHVTLVVQQLAPTASMLSGPLGFRRIDGDDVPGLAVLARGFTSRNVRIYRPPNSGPAVCTMWPSAPRTTRSIAPGKRGSTAPGSASPR